MQDLAKAMKLTPEEIAEFNAKCDYLASKMSAEEAMIYLARTYTAEEKMAFMMASAITLSLIGDGLLCCPSLNKRLTRPGTGPHLGWKR